MIINEKKKVVSVYSFHAKPYRNEFRDVDKDMLIFTGLGNQSCIIILKTIILFFNL